ncbi:MAG: acyl carrier protein [Paludibacteraceae bacterium]|nr:acyl carrier protein [Paludibacteraceae bacterium]MBP5664525.1 acyl carrier protein [Bacteroidales bacterium]
MTLEEFVTAFADEFDETPAESFAPATVYKDLDEWGSLTALSIIALAMEGFGKKITGADLRSVDTIEDLYNLIQTK